MNPKVRRRLAIIAMLLAAAASIATTYAPAGFEKEARDQLYFTGDQRSKVRHLRVEIVAGSSRAHVRVDVEIDTGGFEGKRPVELTVIRDRDGASIANTFGDDYEAGIGASLAGSFTAIDACEAGQTCEETFTLTFQRISEDPRATLRFDWIAQTWAEYPNLEVGGSPPPGAALAVEITR